MRVSLLRNKILRRLFAMGLALSALMTVVSVIFEDTSSNHRRDAQFGWRRLWSYKHDIVRCIQQNITRPHLKAEQLLLLWQPVNDDGNVYVYSAFHDNRDKVEQLVRIVAIIKITKPIKTMHLESNGLYYCQIWYSNSTSPSTVQAVVDISPEYHLKRFGFALVSCNIELGVGRPEVVSLTTNPCSPLSRNHLFVNPPSPHNSKSTFYNYTVCVAPLNYRFNNVDAFVEMIEVNRLLGADRFVFYDYSTGRNMKRYLEMYAKMGLVEVLLWKVPVEVDKWPADKLHPPEIHYFGQVAALNDCVYRYMFSTRYVVLTDLDEFIIPRQSNVLNWDTMLGAIHTRERLYGSSLDRIGAYKIRNVFFRTDIEDDLDIGSFAPEAKRLGLLTLLKLRREKTIQTHGSRAKYIAKPSSLVIVGVHSVARFVAGSQFLEVGEDSGLVHHYRNWAGGTLDLVRDTTMLKFKDSIVERVSRIRS